MAKSSSKPTVVSLFTGAGGMDEGFKAANFKILACMDIESWACDTLRANTNDTIIVGPSDFSGDIKKIPPKEFSEITGIKPGELDVLTGGPPCQPFSAAANQRFLKSDKKFKRRGFSDAEKGTLLLDYIEYIEFLKPRVFLLENVPGLLTIDGGEQLSESLSRLRAIGYKHTEPKITEASNYGVPQSRNRMIVWGTNKTGVTPKTPETTHGGGLFLKEVNTVSHALYGFDEQLPNHEPRQHKEESISRYRTLEFGKREKLGRVDRLDPLKPSKTVIAGGTHGGGRSHLHPFIARTMTVRECARLQTFKDDYVFHGNMSRQFTQVGNAVPPLLAEHFAREIGREVFDLSYPEHFEHELFLDHGLSPEKMADYMLIAAKNSKPAWIYHTHSTQ